MVPAILPHIRPVLATRDGADTGKAAVKVSVKLSVKLSVKDMIRDAAGREGRRPDRGAGQAPGAPSDSTDSRSPSTSTRTVSPSCTSPARMARASWSPMAVWTRRRSGRAP